MFGDKLRSETGWKTGLGLRLSDNIYRYFHRRSRSSVFKPVQCVPVLGPAHTRPIVRGDPSSVVSDRSLQYVDGAWSALMIVNRPEDAPGLDRQHAHPQLTARHAFDLGAKVYLCE